MILLSIYEILIIATAAGATIVAIPAIFFYIKTRRFRKRCKADDPVKFYDGEDKYYGRILRRIGDQCYIEFLNQDNKKCHRYYHVNFIFPPW